MHKTPLETYRLKISNGYLQSDEQQEQALEYIEDLYNSLIKLDRKFLFFNKKNRLKGVYLYGGVGRGKTMVMDTLFSCLPQRIKRRRVHFHEFMIEAHDFMHHIRQKNDRDTEQAIMKFSKKIAHEARVLCFDEFHVTNIADAMILSRLFSSLFEAGVVIVSTSNWPPDQLYENGLQRDRFLPFIDVLKKQMDVVAVDGPTDYRVLCLTQEGVYFRPLNRDSRERIDHLFRHLIDHAPPRSDYLTVKGRKITVPLVANGVARFEFGELCGQPLGAEDYLTIAKNYHTVFIENIPEMWDEQRNEAKRFMILIDAFYEQGVNLVVSADAEPDRLYSGDDYEFEFQRTVSRLIEMQSEAYISASE